MAKRKKVLIVDDDETMRALTALQMEGLGFTADVFDSAPKALEAYEENDYDLIFMDIQMPGMDGLEATRSIRQREQETNRKRTAIIALTASREKDSAIQAGMDDFLFKPVLLGALRQVVSNWNEQMGS